MKKGDQVVVSSDRRKVLMVHVDPMDEETT